MVSVPAPLFADLDIRPIEYVMRLPMEPRSRWVLFDLDIRGKGLVQSYCHVLLVSPMKSDVLYSQSTSEHNVPRTEYQLADIFTKALPEDRFQYLVRRIGMRCLTPAELEVLTNESA
ncbi:hypothetical protein Tco_0269601 [Tanacetum coccineum]